METKTALEWTFTPLDFFEQEIEFDNDEYSIKIMKGSIRATLFNDNKSEEYFGKIQEEVNDIFKSVQLENQSQFKLSDYSIVNINSDGTETKNIIINVNLSNAIKTSVEYSIRNADGTVVFDSVESRKNKKSFFAKNISKYCREDKVFKSITESFSNSIFDISNSLIHLYEILDSLTKKFGSTDKARKILGIPKLKWSRLGNLSNNEPLKEGRHRGKNVGSLRNATPLELKEAREISKEIILLYLEFLKKEKNI